MGAPDIDLRKRFDSTIAAARMRIAATRPGRRHDPKSERTCKPWLEQRISERTYYRRKAASAPKQAQQHAAHVAAWFATLGAIERLEHRSFMRLCLRPKRAAVVAVLEAYMNAMGMN
ncbi:MAG: hypothetical protein P4M05_28115 [Bradyrhizobium sp.]|nr:hypothetical protein [Bradyrhizobium sp.]